MKNEVKDLAISYVDAGYTFFPSNAALEKMLYLARKNAVKKWT